MKDVLQYSWVPYIWMVVLAVVFVWLVIIPTIADIIKNIRLYGKNWKYEIDDSTRFVIIGFQSLIALAVLIVTVVSFFVWLYHLDAAL